MPRSPFANILKSVHYIDRGLVFLNKPPGLVCQSQISRQDKLGYDHKASIGNDFDYALRDIQKGLKLSHPLYPVHRLDKGTTGSLVLARSPSMAKELSRQFASRSIDKTYLAIVRGGATSFPSQEGTIEADIQYTDGRGSLDLSSRTSNSKTSWKVLASSVGGHYPDSEVIASADVYARKPAAPLTLVQLKLHTGLKHQLRLHMAHKLRVPILGDPLYATANVTKSISTVTSIPPQRIFLHASLIEMDRYLKAGPNKHIRLGLRSPLPADFLKICSDVSMPVHSEYIQGGVYVDGHPIDNQLFPPLDGHWRK